MLEMLDEENHTRQDQLMHIERFSTANDLPPALRARIIAYVKRVSDLSRYYNVNEVLQDLPSAIRGDLSLLLHRGLRRLRRGVAAVGALRVPAAYVRPSPHRRPRVAPRARACIFAVADTHHRAPPQTSCMRSFPIYR